MLVSLFTSSLRRTIPETLWPTYLLARGEWSELDVSLPPSPSSPSLTQISLILLGQIYEPLGMQNKILGYVFLIDAACKVRWAGCGFAKEVEARSLRQATAVLMNRMKEQSEKIPRESGAS